MTEKLSTVYKRAKVVSSVKRFAAMAAEDKKQWEDYEMRKRTAAGDEAAKYLAEMAELYRGKYMARRAVVGSMQYDFGLTDEEIGVTGL